MNDLTGTRPTPEEVRAARAAASELPVSAVAQRGLSRVSEATLTGGNEAEVLVDGPAVFPAMLDMIHAAERSIHFENYIVRDDETGRAFADALEARARDGLEVKLLYDWFGSFLTPNTFWDRLRKEGVEVRAWGRPSRPSLGLVQRDHRKLLVADGRAAVAGGFCIGAEWMGTPTTSPWRDTGVRMRGPIVAELERSFLRMWRWADGVRTAREGVTRPAPDGDVAARVVEGEPLEARAYRFYELMAALAEHNWFLTGAYPLTPAPLRRALASAARAGVDVRLLVPGRSNWLPIDYAARIHYGSLLDAGVRIYEWEGPMLHAKTMVADSSVALIGSSNLNPFSLLGNYELDIELQDRRLAKRMEEQFNTDLENAREVTLAEWRNRSRTQRLREWIAAAALWLPYKLYTS